jgi:hypothetical protein
VRHVTRCKVRTVRFLAQEVWGPRRDRGRSCEDSCPVVLFHRIDRSVSWHAAVDRFVFRLATDIHFIKDREARSN